MKSNMRFNYILLLIRVKGKEETEEITEADQLPSSLLLMIHKGNHGACLFVADITT